MKYISTRGGTEPVGFCDAVMMGLARDGGLLLPERIPDVSDQLRSWRELDYVSLAEVVMSLFVDLPCQRLREIVAESYSTFRSEEVTPIVEVGGMHVLELFHGPTLAFKDVALQFLGNVFAEILSERGGRLNILAATSGDTGSAAIYGVRGKERVRIFVMHPKGRISPSQERQMTAVLDENVFNVAVEGTFDDCQAMLKSVFGDLDFKDSMSLGAVNSINWARVLAQIVYFFYGAFRVMERTGAARVSFSVPTGNFGDIFAGYVAARMGLPVSRLVLATNENDILSRFFRTGVYARGDVHSTISPSMDIQIASNFERYLFYRANEDAGRLRELMDAFAAHGRIDISGPSGDEVDALFRAGACNTADTLETIREAWSRNGYLLDPHSAVGVAVARRYLETGVPMICLATAHPAKFSAAISEAVGEDVAHHAILDALEGAPTRCDTIPASSGALRAYVESHVDGVM